MLYSMKWGSDILRIITLGECPSPSYINEISDFPTLIAYPTSGADFGVHFFFRGVELRAPVECIAAFSYFLHCARGLPREAVSVRALGRVFDLPKLDTHMGLPCYKLSKCKEILTKKIEVSGGIRLDVETVEAIERIRVVRAPDTVKLKQGFLLQLKVVAGLPSAALVVAYREDEAHIRAASTSPIPTLDAAVALAQVYFASARATEKSSVKITIGGREFDACCDGENILLPLLWDGL